MWGVNIGIDNFSLKLHAKMKLVKRFKNPYYYDIFNLLLKLRKKNKLGVTYK